MYTEGISNRITENILELLPIGISKKFKQYARDKSKKMDWRRKNGIPKHF